MCLNKMLRLAVGGRGGGGTWVYRERRGWRERGRDRERVVWRGVSEREIDGSVASISTVCENERKGKRVRMSDLRSLDCMRER